MNSNMFHNLANFASIGLAALTAGLLATGCVTTAAGGFDCHASFFDPMWTVWAIGSIQALKILVNVARDGFGGLFKPQPPVV